MQRPVHIIIPFKLDGAKSRLSPVLSPEERRQLARAMLRDVLDAVFGTGSVTLLARSGFGKSDIDGDFDILECSLELNDALNALIEDRQRKGWQEDLLIVMADLAILTQDDVSGIILTEGDVVLSPGRGGGTNMILIRDPKFRTRYSGLSFPKHLRLAKELCLKVAVYESYRAGCDIDEPSDMAEVLIHSWGKTRSFLKDLGFVISENGRAGCIRVMGEKDQL